MKKYSILPILAATAIMASCTAESAMLQEPSTTESDGVLMTVSDFEFQSETRTVVSTEGKFSWSKNDQVGVWPTLDPTEEETPSQVLFTTQEGGARTATFTGSGWGLMPERTYYAYYPYSKDVTATLFSGSYPNSYTQVQDNSTSHLGAYDFMYAAATAPAQGNVAFQFHHLGSLMKLCVSVPESALTNTFVKAVITAGSQVFPQDFKYNPTEDEPEVKVLSMSNTQTLVLGKNGAGIEPVDGVLTLWLMVGECDLTDMELTLVLYDGQNNIQGTFMGARQQRGHAREYAVSVVQKNPAGTVDLGIEGVYWAVSNLTVNGLTDPTEFGDYFTWGDTEVYYTAMDARSDGDFTATWKSGYESGYTKDNYAKNTSRGKYEAEQSLSMDDDAAFQILGEGWMIPSKSQADALQKACTFAAATVDGVSGVLATSKTTGNSLFFPLNGYFSDLNFKGCTANNPGARMWLRENGSSGKSYQFCWLTQGDTSIEAKDSHRGTTIRPVYVTPVLH